MYDPNFIILYVDSPSDSVRFYQQLLSKPALEASPTFALFALDSGVMLGLWSKHTVEPAAQATGNGGEIAFSLADAAAVDRCFADWTRRGLAIAQPLIGMDFGYTFVALDPDGHRLRVFTPTAA
ncbi:extradiol dioxygenase [Affinibrenneria salicis]|uniref:Phenazine antibiotic resistance protein n=1 Tax=Affinibrenneria salicis TaxID=2590031 RepID=A0A5J5G4G5_9GAMM|nr:VOC family protein [Affinibrenneria salicis]KAA9001951.1 extradiol dioxygenase [Affinibrenneria salicis]